MKRRLSNRRFRSLGPANRGTRPRRSRRISVEPLEQRNLLAVVVVDNVDTTFDDAITQANGDADIGMITFEAGLGTIELDATVEYTGGQDLTIDGNGATIEPSDGNEGAFDLFASTGDADLTLRELTLQDGLDGIAVEVSAGATGVVSVTLQDVAVQDCAEFGVHVSDAGDSAAGIDLAVSDSIFTGNGTGATDSDGVRVDETADGHISATVRNSQFDGNGGDGLELDEAGAGDVALSAIHSTFNENGFFDEDDLDDGLDIDEADGGDIRLTMVHSEANGNADEGLDLDEEGDGNMGISLKHVTANGNEDEGIKAGEENDGGLSAELKHVEVNGTLSQEGIALKEEDEGDLDALLVHVTVSESDKDGVEIEEKDDGNLAVTVVRSEFSDNEDFGLKVEQGGDGVGSLRMVGLEFDSNNGGPEEEQWETDGVDVTIV